MGVCMYVYITVILGGIYKMPPKMDVLMKQPDLRGTFLLSAQRNLIYFGIDI